LPKGLAVRGWNLWVKDIDSHVRKSGPFGRLSAGRGAPGWLAWSVRGRYGTILVMAASRLNQYRSFLTADEVAAGITCAAANARRLAEDAQMLFDAERYPSAIALAVLSLEEAGKQSILREMSTATTQEQILGLWKRYRRHTAKHSLTLMPERVAKGATRAVDFRDCVGDSAQDEKAAYDALKQLGLYTDCLGNGHWSVPTEVIDRNISGMLVRIAMTTSARERQATQREIELWVTHMQTGITRPNLIRWAGAMVAEGLHPRGYAEQMAEFTIGIT
jgi:AbiV family abortive infection protein